MIQHAIAVMFQIHEITPTKACWVAITLANVLIMIVLLPQMRLDRPMFFVYLVICAATTLAQGTEAWNLGGEIWLAMGASLWVWTMLPKHKHGRIFALSIGLVVTCVLMLAVPPPWPGYDPAMYFTRLYSTAAFFGLSVGSAMMTRRPETMLAIPWFLAVLIATSQRGFDRWAVGIYANLTWTACLICWLAISRRAHLASSSTPDAPAAHPRYPQSLV